MHRFRIVLLLLLSLFLSNAILSHAATTVIPKVHRQADEGYFSVAIPLPEDVAMRWLWLVAKPEDGDIFMVYVTKPTIVDGKPQGTDLILTGRYGKPGRATIVITGRDSLDPGAGFRKIMTVRMDLPGAAPADPSVMKTWANMHRSRLASIAYRGGDSFATYWNMAAALRYGLEPSEGTTQQSRNRFEEQPDVYDIFTGAAAIQESLQLEVLGSRPVRGPVSKSTGTRAPAMASLPGPSVRSHPFTEMLKGKSPKLTALSALIPADQYAVFFADINKEIELSDLMEEWGGSLLETVHASSRDFKVRKKLTQQLCLETSTLTRLFGDRVIGAMAFTGSDPFLKEGSDLTVLFALKDRDLFLKQIEKRYREAVSERKASRSDFSSAGKNHLSVTTFDRRVSSYTVILGDVAVVSNSLEAMNRIIQASNGKTPALADALDFRYMRTIFPDGDANEDIFIYLSDAHIRRLVGPVAKIEEARRMKCAANLQILANARFWYRSERGRVPTLQNLRDEGYLGAAELSCPDGGSYAFDRSGEAGCSIHNRVGYLTPLTAIRAGSPTEQEQTQYRAFVENYNRYWTRFFDPIGIRVKMGETVRIETCILPLIENSWYDNLVAFSGRETGSVSEASVLPRTIVSLRGHVSKDWLAKTEFLKDINRWGFPTGWLGEDFSLNLCDGPVLFTVDGRAAGFLGQEMGRSGSIEPLVIGYILSAVNLPTYLSVKVTDPGKAEQLLPAVFLTMMARHGSGAEGFRSEAYSQEPYRGKKISVLSFSLFVAKLRLYTAVVGDRLIVASRRDIVTDLIDASTKGGTVPGNLEFSVYRTAFNQIESTVSLGYQEDIRSTCQKNLALVEAMQGFGNVSPDDFKAAAFALRGYEPYCPGGGRYSLDPESNRATCSIHGTVWKAVQPVKGPDDSPFMKTVNSLKKINARLSFTPEGLMATVELQRGK